ncbi:MAG: IS110 family transposase [Clostridia bacterium]|nr:IS110 family transposase [Clostridia bacterium]
MIGELDVEIDEIEAENKQIVDNLGTTILTIPGIGYATDASSIAKVGDFSKFETPDKMLAFAGMSPSTYQSGQLINCYAHMEKRGSK